MKVKLGIISAMLGVCLVSCGAVNAANAGSTVTVPTTFGQRANTAISMIEHAGLSVTTKPARNPADTYVSAGSSPRGGSHVARGSHVTLNLRDTSPPPPLVTPPPVTIPPAGPSLPGGVTGTFVSEETGAQLFADPGWQQSSAGQIEPASNCTMWSPATMTVDSDGTSLDMFTPAAPDSWDCVALESNAAMSPGHIWQLSEYIPAMADGDIADYPAWWMTNAAWSSEVDMAEANDWGGNTAPQGSMCLDIHLNQGTDNTSPDCLTEAGGWHTYTFVWAASGTVTMYYDGVEVDPLGISGTTATDMHMIIWNNDNGGINSTLKLGYLAEWNL
jgi:hypothetical protein